MNKYSIDNVMKRMSGATSRSDYNAPFGEKGQKRSARPKPSGAAAAKRASKKRNNIRKHG